MTYHSLTPRQQRVWDAAYGAAFAAEWERRNEPYLTQAGRNAIASEYAALRAHYAANSIQPDDDGKTTTD